MKKSALILSFIILFAFYSCLIQRSGKQALDDLQQSSASAGAKDSLSIFQSGLPEEGNPEAGYQYLLYGNGFSSGIPYKLYRFMQRIRNSKLSALTGNNKYVLNNFIVFKNETGSPTAAPGCLHCHSQHLNDKWIIGLGNSYGKFQVNNKPNLAIGEKLIKLLYGSNSNQWQTAKRLFETGQLISPQIMTEAQGPSAAHRIAELIASYRDPETLVFRADTNYFFIPPVVIPEDVPPLWNFKKKKAFFINAMGQGDFFKHLMCGTTISLEDTAEARAIYNNMKDVWAYIKTLTPPPYPYPVDTKLAEEGKLLFTENCSDCHGTYGKNEYYPNKLVAPHIIGTDSMMLKYYSKYPEYEEWYNKSWFATSTSPGFIKPQYGYVAPPLNGVWITAPYFHNGSVPTIEGVLNSEMRPKYWKRSFSKEKYDYEKLGWKYNALPKPGGKKIYNTSIPGYGNHGHYFGDHLTAKERKAVIEYLKTL